MRESLVLTIVLILFLDICENKKTMNSKHLIKTDKHKHFIIETKEESGYQKRARPKLQNKAEILPEGKHLRQL